MVTFYNQYYLQCEANNITQVHRQLFFNDIQVRYLVFNRLIKQ